MLKLAWRGISMYGLPFATGIRIQNAGTNTATITITYYDNVGNQLGSPETISGLGVYIAANASHIPGTIGGAAIITADQPIVALVNIANSDTTKDLAMTYDPPNR